MQIITHSEKDNLEVAKNFLENISSGESAVVVGLYGNLGVGKTAFTKAVAKKLGVEDVVTSPTFVIEKIYELTDQKFKHLIHIDAYRLESQDELLHLGWKEITSDPGNLIFIEWPERVSGIMPEHIKIKFTTLPDENSREIEIEMW
ncbi:MAG: tRNA (adenosine(37)-N6)-threonylcarbamoyltransferase complex ATPase subunit type 1 TsaE [Minisyncoccia bacterium]